MTPGALAHLADTLEPRSPGFAAVLREWAHVLGVGGDGLVTEVLKEARVLLAGARRLAALVPQDEAHSAAVRALSLCVEDGS